MLIAILAAMVLGQIVIIHHMRRIFMALDLAGLQVKLDALKVSVDALVALPSNPAPVDLTPAGDAVDALKASVDEKLTAPV